MTNAICERRERIRERLANAMRRSGRPAGEVRLCAVSKYQPIEAIADLAACGQIDFGENYIQEVLAKQDDIGNPQLKWHFIGKLQTKKAKVAAGRFCLVHTVDSAKLAQALHKRAAAQDLRQPILLQVNIGDEPQKSGVAVEELVSLAEEVVKLDALELRGLMCMPPFSEDPEATRPHFARLRRLRDDLSSRLDMALPELSMGMTQDFEQAAEEGATIVRVGTALFGPRAEKP